jgi:hypothetical protein
MQMVWAILQSDPDRRQKIQDDDGRVRDVEAVMLSEWMRKHIGR